MYKYLLLYTDVGELGIMGGVTLIIIDYEGKQIKVREFTPHSSCSSKVCKPNL